jgi:hypothetical protein
MEVVIETKKKWNSPQCTTLVSNSVYADWVIFVIV